MGVLKGCCGLFITAAWWWCQHWSCANRWLTNETRERSLWWHLAALGGTWWHTPLRLLSRSAGRSRLQAKMRVSWLVSEAHTWGCRTNCS